MWIRVVSPNKPVRYCLFLPRDRRDSRDTPSCPSRHIYVFSSYLSCLFPHHISLKKGLLDIESTTMRFVLPWEAPHTAYSGKAVQDHPKSLCRPLLKLWNNFRNENIQLLGSVWSSQVWVGFVFVFVVFCFSSVLFAAPIIQWTF